MSKESVIIKKVTFVTTKEGQELVILHTTKCKVLKDKDNNPVERFKLSRKVFAQRAKELDKPLSIFTMDCIGATYEYEYKAVKAGDAWLTGEGTYTTDHNAKVNDSITISSAVQAEDVRMAKAAYYTAKFGSNPQETAIAPVSVSSIENAGDDLPV
jgi:hypothetical protein